MNPPHLPLDPDQRRQLAAAVLVRLCRETQQPTTTQPRGRGREFSLRGKTCHNARPVQIRMAHGEVVPFESVKLAARAIGCHPFHLTRLAEAGRPDRHGNRFEFVEQDSGSQLARLAEESQNKGAL